MTKYISIAVTSFLIGIFLGIIIGAVIMGLMASSSRADRQIEQIHENDDTRDNN